MMIALLMAGQHSSSSTSAWIMLRLATRPDIQEELLEEQKEVLGEPLPPLTYESLQKLQTRFIPISIRIPQTRKRIIELLVQSCGDRRKARSHTS